MATSRTVVIETKSDISNEPDAETFSYGVNGNKYEIDLTKAEAEEFMEVLQPYLAVSRTKGSGGGTGSRAPRQPKGDAGAIRAWAAENGYEVNATGRIPNDVRTAYEDAQKAGGKRGKRKAAADAEPEVITPDA